MEISTGLFGRVAVMSAMSLPATAIRPGWLTSAGMRTLVDTS